MNAIVIILHHIHMTSPIFVSKEHVYTGHSDCIYTLATYNEKSFFSSGGDGQVVLWSLDRLEAGQLIAKVSASVYALHYDAIEKILVIGQNFDGIHLIDPEKKKVMGSLKLTDQSIFDIISDERNWYVVTGGGELIIVEKKHLRIAKRVIISNKSARSIVMSNQKLYIGCSDFCLKIYDLNLQQIVDDIPAHSNSIFTTVISPDCQYLLTAGRDAHFKAWNLDDLSLKRDVAAHLYAINHLAYSPDHQHFVTCSMDKSIKIWDAATFSLKKVIDKSRHAGHGTSVNKLLWMPYCNFVVSASDDRSIAVWKIDFGSLNNEM